MVDALVAGRAPGVNDTTDLQQWREGRCRPTSQPVTPSVSNWKALLVDSGY